MYLGFPFVIHTKHYLISLCEFISCLFDFRWADNPDDAFAAEFQGLFGENKDYTADLIFQ